MSLNRMLLIGACVLAVTGLAAPQAEAQLVPSFPFGFPFFADCGTVGTVTSFVDLDGNGQLDDVCLAVFADSGGVYTAGGLEAFEVGDRVTVRGFVCLTCLSACPAVPLIFAVVDEGCGAEPEPEKAPKQSR